MAVTAVQVHGASRLVAVRATGLVQGGRQTCTRITSRPGIAASMVLMVMVTEMSCTRSTFMRAIRSCCCPAELERKHGEQKNGEETTHGRKYSCYRVCPGALLSGRSQGDHVVGFHHFDSRMRATLRFIA